MEKRLKSEIGSFYEWEDVHKQWFQSSAEENGRNSFLTWITQRAEGHLNFFESGRAAIAAVVEELDKKVERRICLLPAYICDTVIIPFQRKGWDIHFFQVNSELAPDKEDLELLIDKFLPSVILVIPYYGVDTLRNIRCVLEEYRQARKGIVIEDLTQSMFLMKPCKIDIDVQVMSIRKWLPILGGDGDNRNYVLCG